MTWHNSRDQLTVNLLDYGYFNLLIEVTANQFKDNEFVRYVLMFMLLLDTGHVESSPKISTKSTYLVRSGV